MLPPNMRMKLSWRRPLERKGVCLDGGRRTTQLMRDSLGGIPNATTKEPLSPNRQI